MTIKFNNIYLGESSSVACQDEYKGSFGKLYDIVYDDYYAGEKTFESAEVKMIKDVVFLTLKKANKKMDDIDVIIGADLLNQIVANSYSALSFDKPFIGVYSACASFCEELIVASSILKNNKINNVLVNTSSHNMTAERQFRNPVEYGAPKPKRSTYTATGATSFLVSVERSNIKVSSACIGSVVDMGIDDANDMGSVMAPAAAKTLYDYLSDTNTKPSDYDLILTGDLGVYGKEILIKYMKEFYNIDVSEKLEDAGSILYDRTLQKKVNAGASGPVTIALVTKNYVINKLSNNEFKKVLLIATGALMSPTMNNQKLSIPSIAHLVCLENVL